MNAAKPLASLSASLLARKGAARPAMRSQLSLGEDAQGRVIAAVGGASPASPLDDLGWNDLGEAPQAIGVPVVVQQLEALAAAVAEMPPLPAAPVRMKGGKVVRSALHEGRKAAFTLRLDQYRHIRLRLACTLENRSAQSVVIEALDRFLADQHVVEELAKRTARN